MNEQATSDHQGIAIFGGTFDPIHNGHLRLAWEAWQKLKLNKVVFVPNAVPAHKTQPKVEGDHRLRMIELGTEDYEQFEVSDWELSKGGISYTYELIDHFRSLYPSPIPLHFLLGSDAFSSFCGWEKWQDIIEQVNLWVAIRPESDPDWLYQSLDKLPDSASSEQQLLFEHKGDLSLIQSQTAGVIHIAQTTAMTLSSSLLRDQFKERISPNFLMPKKVWRHIQKHQLYL